MLTPHRYISNIEMPGGKIVYVPMSPPKDGATTTSSSANWTIDFDALERAITPRTKMIVLNTPRTPLPPSPLLLSTLPPSVKPNDGPQTTPSARSTPVRSSSASATCASRSRSSSSPTRSTTACTTRRSRASRRSRPRLRSSRSPSGPRARTFTPRAGASVRYLFPHPPKSQSGSQPS